MNNHVYKLRAWDEVNKIMHYDFEFIRSGIEDHGTWIIFKSNKQKNIEQNILQNFKIMQFTGLKDIEGKEIYSGDIVKGITFKEPFALKTQTTVSTVIEYSPPEFVLKCNLPKGFRTYPRFCDCKVIGNIYEDNDDTDLLEKGE